MADTLGISSTTNFFYQALDTKLSFWYITSYRYWLKIYFWLTVRLSTAAEDWYTYRKYNTMSESGRTQVEFAVPWKTQII
jgi:hypothetical protein